MVLDLLGQPCRPGEVEGVAGRTDLDGADEGLCLAAARSADVGAYSVERRGEVLLGRGEGVLQRGDGEVGREVERLVVVKVVATQWLAGCIVVAHRAYEDGSARLAYRGCEGGMVRRPVEVKVVPSVASEGGAAPSAVAAHRGFGACVGPPDRGQLAELHGALRRYRRVGVEGSRTEDLLPVDKNAEMPAHGCCRVRDD